MTQKTLIEQELEHKGVGIFQVNELVAKYGETFYSKIDITKVIKKAREELKKKRFQADNPDILNSLIWVVKLDDIEKVLGK